MKGVAKKFVEKKVDLSFSTNLKDVSDMIPVNSSPEDYHGVTHPWDDSHELEDWGFRHTTKWGKESGLIKHA